MKSGRRGRRTSDVEVTNVSRHRFWLMQRVEELFASLSDFPWFEWDQCLSTSMHWRTNHRFVTDAFRAPQAQRSVGGHTL